MPSSHTNSAAVVYGSLKEAQAGTTVPSFDLYKLAREEELTAYRALCRVLAMHYGGDVLVSEKPSDRAAVKLQRRLLEDLQEVLCISQERGELELAAAADDDVVKGVHRSGVLRRREDFFDGVEDVEVSRNLKEVRAADDGNTLYAPPHKEVRVEYTDGGGRGAPGVGGASAAATSKARAAAKKKTLASISELGVEVGRAANALLYSDSHETETLAREKLISSRAALLKLREEAAADV